MFRIMLLLCYSLIDTNTIPFYFSLSQIGRAEACTRRFGLTVSFRQFPSSFYESYPMGRTSASTSLMPQLGQVVIPPQHVVLARIYIIERYPNDMSSNDTMIQNKQIKPFYFTRLSIIGISTLLKIYTINKVFYHLNIQ